MRPGLRGALRWGAFLVALALLAVSALPHAHEEPDGQAETCVLCHGLDAAPAAAVAAAAPDLVGRHPALPALPPRAREAPFAGGGPRAPPA